jgi:hypothetical protein
MDFHARAGKSRDHTLFTWLSHDLGFERAAGLRLIALSVSSSAVLR